LALRFLFFVRFLYTCLRESHSLRRADPPVRIFRGSAIVLVCSDAAKQWFI